MMLKKKSSTDPNTPPSSLTLLRVLWTKYAPPAANDEISHVAVISDVHLGHARLPTRKNIADLEMIFPPARMQVLRVIIISGDLFDKRLAHDSQEAQDAARWMEKFLRMAKRYNVAIRILEGTPSHDNRQSQWMVNYNAMMGLGCDLKYYSEISIDELYEGGPSVLYVPDEVNVDATKTWTQVCDLMRSRAIEKVDFAIMHGCFNYQLPVKSLSAHNEDWYESIVNQRIVIGHHHTHSTCGKIVVPGSTDRHMHGQEEDKGHYQFSYSKTEGVYDDMFVINDRSMVFKTLKVVGKTYADVETILKKYQNYPDGSYFRLELSRVDEVYSNMGRLKNTFPQFQIDADPVEAKSKKKADVTGLIERPVLTAIRPDTIRSLVIPKVTDANADVMQVIERALAGPR